MAYIREIAVPNIYTVFILINAPRRDANHKGGAFISPPFRYNMSQHLKCVYRYLRKVPSSLSKRKHITISFTRILQYRHRVLKQKRLSAVFTFPDGWHFGGRTRYWPRCSSNTRNRRDCTLSLTGTPVITAMLRGLRKNLSARVIHAF